MREESILDQLGRAVDEIHVTDELADAIAKALNETHRGARAARERAIDGLRAQITALDEKENRLYDRLDAGDISSAVYKQQRDRVRAERDQRVADLERAQGDIDDRYLVTAQRILELAKNARRLWNTRSPEEKRDFLALLFCNPTLDGRTARYDLKKPFDVLAEMRRDDEWRPQ